jgi:hypothetical protein
VEGVGEEGDTMSSEDDKSDWEELREYLDQQERVYIGCLAIMFGIVIGLILGLMVHLFGKGAP